MKEVFILYLSFEAIAEKLQHQDIVAQSAFPARFKDIRYLNPIEELQKETIYISSITDFSLHNHRIENQSFVILDDLGLYDKIDISKQVNALVFSDKSTHLMRVQELNALFSRAQTMHTTLQQMILDDQELDQFWNRVCTLFACRMTVKQDQQVLFSTVEHNKKFSEEKIEKSYTVADIKFDVVFYVPETFNRFEQELLEQFEPLFFQALKRYTSSFEPMEKKMSKIILNLLQSTTPAVRPLEDTVWEDRHRFQMYLSPLPENIEAVTKKLTAIDAVAILTMPISDCLFVLYAKDHVSDWELDIEKVLEKHCTLSAKSHPFTSVEEIQMQWKNTYLLLQRIMQTEATGVVEIGPFTMGLMALKYKEYAGVEGLVHPVIRDLYQTEDKESIDLLETLYVYLKHERSYLKTSKELDLHRNSIVYRINKLTTKYEMDLEDPSVRLQLLLSYNLIPYFQN